MDDSVIRLTGVSMRRDPVQILNDVNWIVKPGQHWVLLGPNGCGKTTVLRIAAGMQFPTKGSVQLLGHQLGRVDVFTLRPRIGFASTSLLAQIPAGETVHNAVITGLTSTLGRWREQFDAEQTARADRLLEQLGLSEFPHRRIGVLSEGERRRVGLARALMSQPELLLQDEPAAGLDLLGREDQLLRFEELVASGTIPTSITVTHHLEEISPAISHVALMSRGTMVATGPIQAVLTDELLTAAYGRQVRVDSSGQRWFAQVVR